MARSPINQQLFINDGTGRKLGIATATWVTQAVNIDEHRRLSITVGFQAATGASLMPLGQDQNFSGTYGAMAGGQGGIVGGNAGYATGPLSGFTGVLQVQTTNELGYVNGGTGTQQAGAGAQPGFNGWTGGLYWQTVQSGTVNVTNSTNVIQIDLTDVGAKWVRVAFNVASGVPSGSVGSGTAHVFLTAKAI